MYKVKMETKCVVKIFLTVTTVDNIKKIEYHTYAIAKNVWYCAVRETYRFDELPKVLKHIQETQSKENFELFVTTLIKNFNLPTQRTELGSQLSKKVIELDLSTYYESGFKYQIFNEVGGNRYCFMDSIDIITAFPRNIEIIKTTIHPNDYTVFVERLLQ